MNLNRNVLNSCIAVLVLCGSAVSQNYLYTQINGFDTNGQICSDAGYKSESSCSANRSEEDGSTFVKFQASGSAEASYGTLKATGHSKVAVFGASSPQAFDASAESTATSYDTLQIIGLQDGEDAYLKGVFTVTGKPGLLVQYQVFLGSFQCYISEQTQPGPFTCSAMVPITYANGEPTTFQYSRTVLANPISNLGPGAPNGAFVVTGFGVSAYGTLKVVNAKGHVIKGITIVGTSGNIYN